MKTIEIVGENYCGNWDKTRTACRGIVIDGERILLSYAAKTNQWMIPGGGLESNESDEECCIREIAEETGIVVETSQCLLEIDEYYGDWKWVNRYFICNKWALEELLNQNWNYDGQCNPFQASYINDIIKKLENGETISEKTIIMDEKGFDATTITQEDVDNYGI